MDVIKVSGYRDYLHAAEQQRLAMDKDLDVPKIDLGDGFELHPDLGFYRMRPPHHISEALQARMEKPEIYTRSWKVHISLVDIYQDEIKSGRTTPKEALQIIATAWDAILPILKKYNIHAKVAEDYVINEGGAIRDTQGRKNIVLYYDKLDDTPEKWRAMLTEVEKALVKAGVPAAGEIPGDKPIEGSKYMHFSSGGKKGTEWERLDPTKRTEEALKGSPFEGMVINAAGPVPPYDGASPPVVGRG